MGGSALILFVCSSLRHALFNSNAWDLGIFDQVIYLISQGQPPFSSLLGFHILGDHATGIFYPLALLYRLTPDVHWLFAVQAIALSLGALPTWRLSLQAGLKPSQALLMAGVYLLYPLIFNVNLADFHPDVMAVPALLWAVLMARTGRPVWFGINLILTLSCKAVLALTVAALGVWLLVVEKKRGYGAIALGAGVAWFLIAIQWVLPTFGSGVGAVARQAGRYAYLGGTPLEILTHLVIRPDLILGKIASVDTVEYLLLLSLPVLWGLSFRHFSALIPAIPALALNLLSMEAGMRNLVHQYTLPILPFLLLVVIATVADQRHWLKSQRAIALWSIVAFLALAKYGFFWSKYTDSLDTWEATQGAIAQIHTEGGVLTTNNITPHVTHRPMVQFTDKKRPIQWADFDYVLLNVRHPGWRSSPEFATHLVETLQQMPAFQQTFNRDQVYLFERRQFTAPLLPRVTDP